ncbi:angiogenic factor with G patch and FHA domains 1 isoform X1 [Osmerus mordax]|uniref:angiogenic factor with G patch and FHA domains 1 isoform X1 n=1 Tax=Osmerus mordax TaxID=8014 RepID=UPI003510CC73
MDNNGEESSEEDVAELRVKVESLKQDLETCRTELVKLQKQLTNSERLQKNTESYNEDLRKQVDKLSAEIHERKKKEKGKTDAETQTEEQTWTETDYYNYYYGGYQNTEGAETQENVVTETQEAAEFTVAVKTEVETSTEMIVEVPVQHEGGDQAAKPEEADGGSIADMLRATAEQAMSQTGFIFDETTGMYYDHSTGFYYDSVSQLYYDNNTGMYYYYDAESGRYQFHSRIEVSAAQATEEGAEDHKASLKKGKKWKTAGEKSFRKDDKGLRGEDARAEDEDVEWVERRAAQRGVAPHKLKRRSPGSDPPSRRSASSKSRRDGSCDRSAKRKKQTNGSRSDDAASSKKKKKKAKSEKHSKSKKKKKSKKLKKKKERREDSSGSSEPEEGEITESEGEWKSTPSFSSSSSSSTPSPSRTSPESDVESPEAVEEVWPPCVRVTVVRSPVLQTGTLFIITADSPATIGREKDVDHAIRIPEMGVSKFHAEVYFDRDQQCYMLVDQGSQNGTVLNGNRILQPKTKCEPCALTHGDEVKMGDTVLSFHIHSGTDTCDGCEPGQVMAHLSKHPREDASAAAGPAQTKEDKEMLRQKELKQMKVKYGLKSAEFEEVKALKNPRYKDRAESRRQTVGSDGVFLRDDAPASVHVEIGEVNKGRKMLEKMGWKKGEGLGKDGAGMKDPIQLKIRKSQSGLGASAALSVEDASLTRTKTQRNWEKARERFADTCQASPQVLKTDDSKSAKPWIKAEELE